MQPDTGGAGAEGRGGEVLRARIPELRGTWAFVAWGSMAMIALIPFTNIYIPRTGEQYSLMSLTQLFLWACLLLSPRVLKRGYSPILAWVIVLMLTRYVYGSLLTTLPEQFADSMRNMIRPTIFAWILTAVMREPEWRRRGCDAFVVGCAFAAALHLMGIGTDEAIIGAQGSVRISAFELNANTLGVIYATGFVTALARLIQPRSGYGVLARLAFTGMGALAAMGLLLTGSRTAALFAGIGSIVLVLVEARRARWSFPAVFAVTLLAAGALGMGLANSVIAQRSGGVVESGVDSEARARMAPVLVDQFLRSPIYGLGPENYRLELGIRAQTGEPRVGIISHNQLLMFAVEMGLFGLIPFLTICGLLLRFAWKMRFAEGGLPLALATPCILTAFTVANISFHWHYHFVVGLVAGAYNAFKNPTS